MTLRIKKVKMQAGIVWAVILVMVFASLIFVSQRESIKENSFEYEDEYAYSILYSLLRSTTNSTDIKCKTTKDIAYRLSLPILEDTYCCEVYDMICFKFINTTLTEKLDKINRTLKKSYIFYFEIGLKQRNNQEEVFFWYGNKTLKICKGNKISAIQYLTEGKTTSQVYAKVLLMRRGDLCLR